MRKFFKSRFNIFSLICIIGFAVLFVRLAYLTLEKGQEYYAVSQERKSVKLTLRGRRGEILDRNGVPLATNRQIYVVQLDRQRLPVREPQLNDVIIKVINIIEKNDDSLIDNLPIKYDSKQGFYYDWGTTNPEYQASRYKKWRKELNIKKELPAEEMLKLLRDKFNIEKGIPDELARKITSVRIDLYMNRYKEYYPIRIAENVSIKTISQVETFLDEMPGVQTIVESGRYYPMGDTAAHIIGYVGRITEDKADWAKDKGYDISKDKVGVSGIESAFEEWLTGSTSDKHGRLWAEINSSGKVVRVLDEQSPKNGNNIMLTLDSRLQRSAELILEDEITKMKDGLPPYDGDKKLAPLAKNGAAVVIDVKTGEILAMASYPSFDLNLFTNGISSKDFKSFQEDPANPLYAIAFQGGLAPGSVFKMLIGAAGLSEGKVGLNEKIFDHVRYTKYNKVNPPSCSSRVGHGNEDIVRALKHSCNYYFYEVADRLGIDTINKWAGYFGLTGRTGLEIIPPKMDYNIVANLDVKLKAERNSTKNGVKWVLNKYGYLKKAETDEQKKVHNDLLNELVDFKTTQYHEKDTKNIQSIFDRWEIFKFEDNDNDGKDDMSGKKKQRILYDKINASYEIRSILVQYRKWRKADTVITGIGQSYTQISPLGIARYVAAIANGGKVMETRVVKNITSADGKILKDTKPVMMNKVDIRKEYLDAIKEGMHKVVYEPFGEGGGGTAVKYFADMDPKITLAGKTGTAQVIPGKEERNNAWFVAFSPYENPEIAIAVAIPNGRTSGNAAPIARRILEEYYRIKNQHSNNNINTINNLQR